MLHDFEDFRNMILSDNVRISDHSRYQLKFQVLLKFAYSFVLIL